MKKYYIFTIGCQMNKADSERLAAYLDNYGLKETKDRRQADLAFFVTCGVRQSAEDRVYGLINSLRHENPQVVIVVTGCLSQRSDVQEKLSGRVDLFLPIFDLLELDGYLQELGVKKNTKNQKEKTPAREYLSIIPKYDSPFLAYVPIGNGCNNFCSYCVVPYARGREKYRPAKQIIAEVKGLIKKGYKEIVLIAQNVNSFHNGLSFPELIKAIDALPGDFWLRFATSHPKDMSPELIKAIGQGKHLCEQVHFAVQSGDDEILKRMNRGYTAQKYLNQVKKIRLAAQKNKQALPIAISTDIIVGFPGETKRQFLNTVKLMKAVGFDQAFVARYSPRFGTASYRMIDDVSLAEKKRREEVLNKILRRDALKNNKWYINKTVDVLVSGRDRKGGWQGNTRTAKSVSILGLGRGNFLGKIIPVKISSVRDFGLTGEYVKEKNEKGNNKQ
ncbi:MAG TPA: tRNA (N6-isopentenyl adenosine(37)-C2)-methylthiotransferase MiaB [bacterium]|nr:tRNA (N6-isopentenyl adenosine(37)-C2)-methylthiotransferase MiaB [bacterium]HPT29728.1 tRNA (N6-isopentenyl adenosine(37)-C2)-methylthiotransferase MiaB [bacterium]